jgi:hypothetical protein
MSSTTMRRPKIEVKVLPAERPSRLTDKMVKVSDSSVPRAAVATATTSAARGGVDKRSQCRSAVTRSPR